MTNTLAQAQTIVYDNGINTANVNGGFTSDPNSPRFTADTFTLAAPSTFNQVRFLGFYTSNTPTASTDNFTITFYNTLAGTPDINPFAGGTFAIGDAAGRTATGVNPFASDIYSYVVNLASTVSLDAGTYGISIVNDTTNDTDNNWVWATSFSGGSVFFRTNQADGWTVSGGETAFTLVSATAPEPGTLALLLPFAVGIFARYKRRS